MNLSTTQILIALVVALVPGTFAARLGLTLFNS